MLALHKRTLGAFVYFAEAGTVIDTVTVSSTAYPDITPTTNWTDLYLGCTQEMTPEVKEKTETTLCPQPQGGYEEEEEVTVLADFLNWTSRAIAEPTMRLALGANAAIVDATPFQPFANRAERSIYGWLKVHWVGENGDMVLVANLWGKLRLAEPLKAANTVTLPKYRFQILNNTLNTAVTDGVSS